MLSMNRQISSWIAELILKLYPSYSLAGEVELTPATARQFGHYQCNQAMRMGAELKCSPRSIATALAEALTQEHSASFEKIEVAGPGFINLTLSDQFLCSRAAAFTREEIMSQHRQERVLIDFSGPNTAKEMHVGHLRSTIIGDCLARVHEFLGFDVLRVNHIGNWGTQFGMLIAWLKRNATPEALNSCLQGQSPEGWDLAFLMHAYRSSKELFDAEPLFAEQAKLSVVALQSHEVQAFALWNIICEISRRAYDEIYRLLDVQIDECGESFYNPMLQPMIQELETAGLLTPSGGAKCLFVEGYEIPLILQKSDGGFNYDSTDLAAMRYRCETLQAKQIMILTDAGQKLHFELIFGGARQVGYLPPGVKATHVPFGLVLGPDGKKFKTRSGQTEKLADLLQTAVARAREILEERATIEPASLDSLSQALGINAVKYADLSTYRLNDYSFSYEKMLRFEGNTAAFLMYSYVRALGVLRRLQTTPTSHFAITHPSERQLLLTLLQFDEALTHTLNDLAPNRLADYLWILAQDFNAFFRDCRVEASEHESSRACLVQMVATWLGKGLELLGLRLVERM